MSTEIRNQVDEYLQQRGVTFVAKSRGETKRGDWVCDEWCVTFANNYTALITSYYTGTGHRKSAVRMPPEIARLGKYIVDRVKWERQNLRPVAPHAADVLYSLILDGQAADMCFRDWANEYGYNSDSISDRNLYDECCNTAFNMRGLFTRADIDQLRELTQDL